MFPVNPFNRSDIRGILVCLCLVVLAAGGCSHYPVNQPLDQHAPDAGYRMKNMGTPGNSEDVLFILTFSGGGTRAAALSFGLLEELAGTEITVKGKKKRLLDEVDIISGVSGGSFTAAYYGLFGDRIFEDFQEKFLKKNIQGALFRRKYVYFPNWFRLMSPNYSSSDMAADYYNKYVFEGKTFEDILARKGPAIIINGTDMTEGTDFPFIQEYFDLICSDLSSYSVSRAAAASSAVPVVLSPISLQNYHGRCGYTPEWLAEGLKEKKKSRQYYEAIHIQPYLDPEKKKYVHLVDGGVADNLGIRVVINSITQKGDFWSSLKYARFTNTHKVIFIVVNAATGVDKSPDLKASGAGIFDILRSVSKTPLSRYTFETIELLKLKFSTWAEDVRTGRCGDPDYTGAEGACDDIEFHLIQVDFNDIPDKKERDYFMGVPTSFKLDDETVDKLRAIAGRLLNQSDEYQQLLKKLR